MSKEKVLRDALKPSKKEDGKSPWSFKAPSYDNRTSCSISAGNDYGVGFKTPVGKTKARGLTEGPIPFGCVPFEAEPVIEKQDTKG